MHLRLEVGRLWYFLNPVSILPQFLHIPSLLRLTELGDFVLQSFPVHHIIDMDLQNNLRSLRESQAVWAHNLWELSCAGFRHSAGFYARVILDGAACRLGGLGELGDVLGVLGGERVVPIVVCVLVSW